MLICTLQRPFLAVIDFAVPIRTLKAKSNTSTCFETDGYKCYSKVWQALLKKNDQAWKLTKAILIVQTQQTFFGLQDGLKTSSRHVLKTSLRGLQDVLEDLLEDKILLHWRRLEDFLNICLKDGLKTCVEEALKTCLEDVLKTNKMFTGDICI